jgi:hypothetical protein
MPYTNTGKNKMLDALGVTEVSAHTADPGEAGNNEVTGGTYARASITYSAASGGSKSATTTPSINIPAGTTVTHVGYWDAAGNFLGYSAASESFTNDGTLTLTSSVMDLNLGV